jgi:histidyl-tRNA synthetase
VRLSDRRVLTAMLAERGVPANGLSTAYQFIDKVERLGPESVARFQAEHGAALGTATVADLLEITRIRNWDALDAELSGGAAAGVATPLRETAAALEAMELGAFVDLDFTIVRGLAYYTGTVFELFDAGGKLRAICGGGRYDDLLGVLGGTDLPALGFGMGDVVLTELLRDRGLLPVPAPSAEVFVAVVTGGERPLALRVAHRLRDAGFRVEYSFADQAVGKQLKLAAARRARVAVVLGPDDVARGEIVVKDLAAGSQRAVPEAELVGAVAELLSPPSR